MALRAAINRFWTQQARPFRAKIPTTLQLEAVECGAAALSMILAYHGRTVPLATLRQECGVSRDGSKASNVLKAARRYRMVAKSFSKSVESLRKLQSPYIIFWNFNHFVVVEGFGDGVVFLNDPAIGHRTIDNSEFETSFTGVVLVLEPGPDFEKGGRRPSVIAALKDRLASSYETLVYCVAAGFLLVISGLVIPTFSQIFLDEIFVAQRTDWLRPMLVAMACAVVLQAILKFVQLRYLRRLMIALSIRMSGRFMWHLLQLPAMFYEQRFPGEVANRSRLNDKLTEVLSGRLADAAIGAVMMVFYAGLMFFYDAVLTSIGIAFALANIVALRWISGQRVEANMRVLQEYGKAQGAAVAGLQSMETIKSSGLETSFFSRWSGHYSKATNAGQQLQLSNQSLSVLPTFLNSLAGVLLVIVGGYRIIEGDLTVGMLVAIQSLMGSFMAPVNMLMGLGGTLQEMAGDLNRVNDVLDYTAEPSAPEHSDLLDENQEPVTRLKGYVDIRNVTFGYSPLEAPLLDDFSVSIRPGQRVALVGRSGSGKTTITKLISGEYTPWKGEVCFDGIPRQEVPRPILVNSFATVAQDIFLFDGTVRDNLTMWDPTVPEQSLVRAAEDAAIHDTILGLAILTMLVAVVGGYFIRRYNLSLMELEGRFFGLVVQMIRSANKIRIAGAEQRAFALWTRKYSEQLTLIRKSQMAEDYVIVLNQALPAVSTMLLFWFGVQLLTGAGGQQMSIGVFLAFNAALGTFVAGTGALSNSVVDVMDTVAKSRRIRPILDEALEVDPAKADPGRLQGNVALSNVCFRYSDDGPMIPIGKPPA